MYTHTGCFILIKPSQSFTGKGTLFAKSMQLLGN